VTFIRDNGDADEVARFESLADDWWDPDGSFRTLHVINPVRLAFIESAAALRGRRVLDVGCGGGLLSEAMAAKGASVTGIDPGEGAIRSAREHLAGRDVIYHARTVEEFVDEAPVPFDVVTCMELLEHVPRPDTLITHIASLLKPGGHFFLATINRNLQSYLTAVIGAEYLLRLLPRGTHEYARFIRPSELAAWLREAGFRVETVSGIQYLPLLNRAFLTDRPTVNYLIHARCPD